MLFLAQPAGYTKKYVLKGTSAWGKLPGNVVWPGGATGYPACDGIYIRKALKCGTSGHYCSNSFPNKLCCGNTQCCLAGTTCCGKECCPVGLKCCPGSYCAASCEKVNPQQGGAPTTAPSDWSENAAATGGLFSLVASANTCNVACYLFIFYRVRLRSDSLAVCSLCACMPVCWPACLV